MSGAGDRSWLTKVYAVVLRIFDHFENCVNDERRILIVAVLLFQPTAFFCFPILVFGQFLMEIQLGQLDSLKRAARNSQLDTANSIWTPRSTDLVTEFHIYWIIAENGSSTLFQLESAEWLSATVYPIWVNVNKHRNQIQCDFDC